MKAHIFIDFWNFQLSINSINNAFRVDWKKISPWLLKEAENQLGQSLSYEGTHVYISYNAKSPNDIKLKDFALNILNRFPGVQVNLTEREASAFKKCQKCFKPIKACPECGSEIHRTNEKGVDTAIVTDMIKLAWEGSLDVAILVSSDKDYIPSVEFLLNKGYKVINGYFPPKGAHLASICWANFDIRKGLSFFSR